MLTPGPELDRRIAEAVGLPVRILSNAGDFVVQIDGRWIQWRPSRDLNHAWQAAEAVGLLEQYSLNKSGELFQLWRPGDYGAFVIAQESTPALAICAAIEAMCEVQT